MKRLILIFSLVFAGVAHAAISANAVWNFRDSATGTAGKNGGFFVTGATGVNKSLQDGAEWPLTTATSGGAGNTILDASAHADMVGNGAFTVSGTNLTLNSWFEVVSVVAGVSITFSTNAAGTSIATGVVANGTINIGGANLLNSTLADDIFEAGTAGNTYYFKTGTYTLGETVTISLAGGASAPMIVRGYTTNQSDWSTTTGTNRPTIPAAATTFTFGANWDCYNVIVTGTASTVLGMGTAGKFVGGKVVNSSTTADRTGISLAADGFLRNSEIISYRGNAVVGSLGPTLMNNYIHSSNVGYSNAGTTAGVNLTGNIIANNVTAAVKFTAALTGNALLNGNTLFGSLNTTGIGLDMATGVTDTRLVNNIITGFVTGVNHADVQTIGFDNYNDYYNNDTDATNWTKGPNDNAVNPSFTNVGQVTGATATTTSGNHLVQSGATFVTSGVTAGRDYVYIISGTGVTAGIYGIASVDSETQITTDITLAADATANKVFQITTGQNFAVGTAMKALGFPGAFQGGYTTGYTDQGAVQRQESGGQTSYSQ